MIDLFDFQDLVGLVQLLPLQIVQVNWLVVFDVECHVRDVHRVLLGRASVQNFARGGVEQVVLGVVGLEIFVLKLGQFGLQLRLLRAVIEILRYHFAVKQVFGLRVDFVFGA